MTDGERARALEARIVDLELRLFFLAGIGAGVAGARRRPWVSTSGAAPGRSCRSCARDRQGVPVRPGVAGGGLPGDLAHRARSGAARETVALATTPGRSGGRLADDGRPTDDGRGEGGPAADIRRTATGLARRGADAAHGQRHAVARPSFGPQPLVRVARQVHHRRARTRATTAAARRHRRGSRRVRAGQDPARHPFAATRPWLLSADDTASGRSSLRGADKALGRSVARVRWPTPRSAGTPDAP